jgi:hypothetical protein
MNKVTIASLQRQIEQERNARQEAEALSEELYLCNQQLRQERDQKQHLLDSS